MPVPKEKFAKEFGLTFDDAMAKGLVFNALDACKYLGVDSEGLDKIWQPSKKVSIRVIIFVSEDILFVSM